MGLFSNDANKLSETVTEQQANETKQNLGNMEKVTQKENSTMEKNESATNNVGEKKSGKVKIYNLIILDESGSMNCITRQTIDGCNETLQTIKLAQEQNSTQEHYASIFVFQTERNVYLLKNEPLSKEYVISDRQYRPGGCTPLYDAIGKTVTELYEKIKNEENSTALVTIITDGMENASKEYNHAMARQLIEARKEDGWVFTFIGANIDAEQTSRDLNIGSSLQFEQSATGSKCMWERERNAKMAYLRSMEEDERMYNEMCFESEEEERRFKAQRRKRYNENYFEHPHTTPRKVEQLFENEIFVFGSNIKGQHNGGAAGFARRNFGAVMGQAEGLQGQSYAIPTVGSSLNQLQQSIERFIEFAKAHSEQTFYVTAIGCGVAGLKPEMIAPSFAAVVSQNISNVWLPAEFWNIVDPQTI